MQLYGIPSYTLNTETDTKMLIRNWLLRHMAFGKSSHDEQYIYKQLKNTIRALMKILNIIYSTNLAGDFKTLQHFKTSF